MGLTNATDQGIDLAQSDLLGSALGVKAQTFAPVVAVTSGAPASGTMLGSPVWLTGGVPYTGIKLRNVTAASGTAPTLAKVGLLNGTGVLVAVSAATTAAASWGTGPLSFAFTANYSPSVAGVYIPTLLVVGSWSVTQPSLILCSVSGGGAAFVADGSNPPVAFALAGQTDFPAIGQSVSIATGSGTHFWMGVY